jgi:hypothetical protein
VVRTGTCVLRRRICWTRAVLPRVHELTKRRDASRRSLLIPLTVLCVTVAGVSFAGCSSSPARGTLTGTFQAVGGPPGTPTRAIQGQITIHGSNGNTGIITVGRNGRFSVNPPVGTYTVSGRSPQYEGGAAECRASAPVTVTTGATSTVEVYCQGE